MVVHVTPQPGHSIYEGFLCFDLRAGSKPKALTIARAGVNSPDLEAWCLETRLNNVHGNVASPVVYNVKIDMVDSLAVCYAVLRGKDWLEQQRRSSEDKARL